MERLERIQEMLLADGLDGLVVMSPAVTCYLSGCYLMTQLHVPDRQAFVIVPAEGEPTFLVCNIEEGAARQDGRIADVRSYVEFVEEPAEVLVAILAERGLDEANIGFEARRLPAESLAHLQGALPESQFVGWDEGLDEAVMVKDPAEIEALAWAGQTAQAAIEAAFSQAEPGSTELAVCRAIFSRLMDEGLRPMFNVFSSGPNTVLIHAEPTERVMRPGDLVRLDIGGRFPSHYLCDMARTGVVGQPSAEQEEAYGKLFQAQQAVFAAIRPGVVAADLFHVCRESFAEQGIPFTMPHIGHGMGIGLHEAPLLHPGNETVLRPGMVLNIEPYLRVTERPEAYHIEDLVVVTEEAARLLTRPQPTLLRLPG